MEYLLKLSDAQGRHMAVLSLPESALKRNAIDVVFDVIGTANPEELVSESILSEGQVDELKALQKIIFDHDAEGAFIRDNVSFTANGGDLNPDKPMLSAFVTAQKEGMEYRRCDVVVSGGASSADSEPDASTGGAEVPNSDQRGSMQELADLLFLHQIAVGNIVEVTREIPELIDVIARAEKNALVEIDVKKAAYKLTEKGKRRHDSYIEEAQNLVKRFDIFSDVDLDANGNVHFDSGLGQDLRVPIFEVEGVDPFRARFLLGLNDGEWDRMDNWIEQIENEEWYQSIFAPIETAPSVDDIGRTTIQEIIDKGKAKMRSTSY